MSFPGSSMGGTSGGYKTKLPPPPYAEGGAGMGPGAMGNPAASGGNPITPAIPAKPGGSGGGAAAGGAGGGGSSQTAPSVSPWASPWGTQYSPNDVAALEADPTTLLMEYLSSQGRNNPLQVARQGDLPAIFQALAPYLNSALAGDAGMSPGLGAGTIAQLLAQYETPGAGGVDVASLLNAILNPDASMANGSLAQQGMYNLAQTPSSDLNNLISAVLGLSSPIMAPYIQNALSQRQSQFGQANLDANGGQSLGSYGQWLLGQGQ